MLDPSIVGQRLPAVKERRVFELWDFRVQGL